MTRHAARSEIINVSQAVQARAEGARWTQDYCFRGAFLFYLPSKSFHSSFLDMYSCGTRVLSLDHWKLRSHSHASHLLRFEISCVSERPASRIAAACWDKIASSRITQQPKECVLDSMAALLHICSVRSRTALAPEYPTVGHSFLPASS